MSGRIIIGDVLDPETWESIPDGSVQCCITSPPYYGLRDYGTATWEGGDSECDHEGADAGKTSQRKGREYQQGHPMGRVCRKCGARRIDNQLGLEKTPEEYIGRMVEVFRHVRDKLRDDGTVWINCGDSYASGKGTCYNPGGGAKSYIQEKGRYPLDRGNKSTLSASGLKPKDLMGIPWMLAFALRADGWYLRQDIIWHKPNPMPESVTDRCCKSHEYVFLLTKRPRYFYDAEAIKERWTSGRDDMRKHGVRTGEAYIQQGAIMDNTDKGDRKAERNQHAYSGGRNKRSVWTIATQPWPQSHFATFPPKLIEPMIKAGTSEKGCCPAMIKKLQLRADLTEEQRQRVGPFLRKTGRL